MDNKLLQDTISKLKSIVKPISGISTLIYLNAIYGLYQHFVNNESKSNITLLTTALLGGILIHFYTFKIKKIIKDIELHNK